MLYCQVLCAIVHPTLDPVGDTLGAREKLAELVAASGMSQAEIARRVGEHTTWVNNRLRGTADVKADDVPRLARALGVQPAAFFEPAAIPPGASAERAALEADTALAGAVSEAVLRVLGELHPDDRAALSELAARLAAARPPAGRDLDAGTHREASISENAARYLTRAWDELPEEEQRFLLDVEDARQRLRQRTASEPT